MYMYGGWEVHPTLDASLSDLLSRARVRERV